MAQKTVVHYYSDLSGDELEPGDATVRFALNGTSFEIDLTPEEQKAFRDLLAPYVCASRKSGAPTRRRSSGSTAANGSSDVTPKEIREWATVNGHDVPDRGRIPALVREAYLVAH